MFRFHVWTNFYVPNTVQDSSYENCQMEDPSMTSLITPGTKIEAKGSNNHTLRQKQDVVPRFHVWTNFKVPNTDLDLNYENRQMEHPSMTSVISPSTNIKGKGSNKHNSRRNHGRNMDCHVRANFYVANNVLDSKFEYIQMEDPSMTSLITPGTKIV